MKKLITSVLFILIVLPCMTQTSAKNDELKFDADYFLMRGEFDKALGLYLHVLESEPVNADIMYRIGICYLNSENEKGKAIKFLLDASNNVSTKYNTNSFKEYRAPVEVFFLLGSAYRVNDQLDEAIAAYEKYKEYLDPKDRYNREATDQYIQNCHYAKELIRKPHNVTFTNMGNVINTSQANFNPVISGDGKILAFTAPGKQGYDIFISTYNDSTWAVPKNISAALGAGKYMKTSSLSYDGNTLLLTMEDPENSDLYLSHFKKGRWSKVVPLPKEINSKWNETNGSFSSDGKILYFTSNRKGGEGDLDIFRSIQQGEIWSAAQNLGSDVNTPYNEETPFVSVDNSVLYFSSEGHQGMGGFDVYRYDLANPDKGVVNVGYPVNTTDNNLFYVPFGDGSTAYYAFRGPDSYGGRDIYKVTVVPDEVEEEAVAAVADPETTITEEAVNAEVVPLADTIVAPITDATTIPEETAFTETIEPASTSAPESPLVDEVPVSPVTGTMTPQVAETETIVPLATEAATIIPPAETETIVPMATEAATIIPPAETETIVPMAAETAIIVPATAEPEIEVPPATETAIEVPQAAETSVFTSPAVEEAPEQKPSEEAVAVMPAAEPPEADNSVVEVPEPEEVTGSARSYTIQFMALRKPVDLQYFKGLSDISLTLDRDEWYRYTWITTTDSVQADNIKKNLVSKGFADAFIRRKSIIPRFTIQVMAVPGPVTDLSVFANLPEISVRRDKDTFCRYTTGWFESKDDARNALTQIQSLGYPKAFVRKVKTLQ